MANDNEILKRLRERSGLEMSRSADFSTLSEAIRVATGEMLGINTLKRLFGFNTEKVTPRLSTMDIIARYLGFETFEALQKEIGDDADISSFTPINGVEVCELTEGARVRITYSPSRMFSLTYLGDCRFVVDEVEGSHNIRKGDILTISQLAVGHRLVVSLVMRDGVALGPYESAKFNGLNSAEIIP